MTSLPAAQSPTMGNASGTVLYDGTFRSVTSPTVAVPPSGVNLASLPVYGSSPSCGQVMTDAGRVGLIPRSPTTGTLWRTDLATGVTTTRDVTGVDLTTCAYGATATAWVTARAPASIPNGVSFPGPGPVGVITVTLWPFNGTTPAVVTPTDLISMRYAGPDGLVYFAMGPGPTERSLRLLSPDLTATTTLHTWPDIFSLNVNSDRPWDLFDVTTSRGAVAWRVGYMEVGYWDATRGTSTGRLPNTQDVGATSVIPGTVTVRVTYSMDDLYRSLAWQPSGGALVPVTIPRGEAGLELWSSSLPDGTPAFGGLLSESQHYQYDDPGPRLQHWVSWSPGSASLTQVVPAPGLPGAPLAVAKGTSGHLLTAYWTSTSTTTVQLRTITGRSTPVVLNVPRALVDYYASWNFGAGVAGSGYYGLSGMRSALPEETPGQLVLRDGVRITGRVPGYSTTVSTSGPYTALTLVGTSATTWVVGPTGQRLATLAGARLAVQDGTRTAYELGDGSLWVRDVTVPVSTTNPRKMASPCGGKSACVDRLFLSGSRLVATAKGRLVAVDLVRRTARTVALGTRTCTAMNGPLVLCPLYSPDPGIGQTIDTSASRLVFRSLPGGVPATLFAGRLIGWTGPIGAATRLAGDSATRVALAPLPVANGAIGRPRVLGPWSPYGDVLSTSYPWRPQLSVTDPLTSWTLTMRSASGRVVRTWTGTAADTEIRGIVWNARDSRGHALPDGTYRWTLTGTSRYGAPVATIGSGNATGTVRIVRQVSASLTIAVTTKYTRYRVATIASQLRRAGSTTGIANRYVTLWRKVGTAAWHQIDSGVTSATGRVAWTTRVSATSQYQVRHPADPVARAALSGVVTVRK